MIFKQAQVRGESKDGKNTVSEEIKWGGFKPGTMAHIVLTGWSFKFTFGDHNLYEIGIWLQKAIEGGWDWCHEVPVDDDGNIMARYYAFVGSENRDNPFTFIINYAVIGE